MQETTQSRTSAWLDNEADVELDSSLTMLLRDRDEQARLQRYALYGSIMRQDLPLGQPLDISQRVAAAIAQEQALTPTNVVAPNLNSGGARSKAALRWLKPVASVAVAASVAVVAVLSVQTWQVGPMGTTEAGMEPALITNPLGGRNPVSFNVAEGAAQGANSQAGLRMGVPMQEAPAVSQQEEMMWQRRQLQSYLIDHQQQLQLRQQAETAAETQQRQPQEPQQ